MGFSSGRNSISLEELLSKVNEVCIASKYLNITEIPCLINSPLRQDEHPSFGIYTFDGHKVRYIDYATGERGGLFDLLSKLWGVPYGEVLERIANDFITYKGNNEISVKEMMGNTHIEIKEKVKAKIEVKVRDWRKYDIDYWESYGVPKEMLEYARVYPISHKIITKNGKRYTFGADKYAYAFVEVKEGNPSPPLSRR